MAVLYCVGHTGFLLKALVHKFTYHPEEELVLVVNNELYKLNYDGVAKLVYKGKFGRIYDQNSAEEILTEEILFQDWEKCLEDVDFSQIKNIYIMFDIFNYIGFFFEKIKQKYSLIELGADQFSNQSKAKSWTQYQSESIQAHFDILEKYNLLESNGLHCTKYYLHPLTTKIINDKIPNEIFNYENLLAELDKKYVEKFFNFYPKLNVPNEKINLVLLNSEGIVRSALLKKGVQASLHGSEIILPYQLLIDYYLPENSPVAIKKHPYNKSLGDKKDFPYVIDIISGKFPSDLMQFCDDIKIDTSINVASTSIEHVKKISENVINLEYGYFFFSTLINKIYIILSFFENIKEIFESCFSVNIDVLQIENFNKYCLKTDNKFIKYLEKSEIPKKSFLIINSNKLKEEIEKPLFDKIDKLDNNSLVAFIGIDDKTRRSVLSRFKNKLSCLSIKIKKNAIRKNAIINIDDEEIFILTANSSIKEKIKYFSVEKTLQYTGITITAAVDDNI